MTSTRVVHVVDDEEAIRRSTGFMLKTAGFLAVTHVSGVAFLREVRHLAPGCILLDLRMPEMDGFEVQRALGERGVVMPIIMLTGNGDISTAVRALKAGAVDFIEKPFEKTRLLAAIATAFDRQDGGGAAALRDQTAAAAISTLSDRERAVLKGLINGFGNAKIAQDLEISPRSVEVHRATLMTKLEAGTLSDVVRAAFAAKIAV